MADNRIGPGEPNFGSATNPADGNNRRKALLQMLMQRAQGGGGNGLGAGNAVASIPFGGLRATPAHRDSQGQGFTHAAQVAAQFVGGLGIGARGGQPQGGSNGNAVSRFLPSDGGPVERHVSNGNGNHAAAPQAPVLDPQSAQAPVTGAGIGAPGEGVAPAPGSAAAVDPGFFSAGGTPTSGASQLIPLGNGAYFDPGTGQVHYPAAQGTDQNRYAV